jgi:energy-converting hydrogenase Eha subunit E
MFIGASAAEAILGYLLVRNNVTIVDSVIIVVNTEVATIIIWLVFIKN